ncbi:MAG: hypothetical protein ACKVQS_04600 [Fimbriimonadaceae bacterium]
MPELHAPQQDVLAQAKRLNVLACGRRWGKTVLGIDIAIRAMLDGHPVAWAAPHYKFLAEPFRTIDKTLGLVVQKRSQDDFRLELATGGTLDCWTLSDTNLGRGRKYKVWIIDEAALSHTLEKAFAESIRPTLIDLSGDAWFLSTPQGRGYFWECFRRGQDSQEPEWQSWQMPTSSNPFMPHKEIQAARSSMTERQFAQEFLAEFGLDEDSVFRNIEPSLTAKPQSNPNPNQTYIAGVDLARVEDFTVITILNNLGEQVHIDRFRRQSWERTITKIATACQRFNSPAVVDASGLGDPIIEQLQATGITIIPFKFTAQSKEPLIQSLAFKLEQNQLKLLDEPAQTNELLAYRATRSKFGTMQYSAPPGQHDDCVIALALAASRIGNHPFGIF